VVVADLNLDRARATTTDSSEEPMQELSRGLQRNDVGAVVAVLTASFSHDGQTLALEARPNCC
jgi:hypothetical protein